MKAINIVKISLLFIIIGYTLSAVLIAEYLGLNAFIMSFIAYFIMLFTSVVFIIIKEAKI